MLPLLPFVAGVAVGVYAANALRRSDVRENLQRTTKSLFDAAQASMQHLQQRSEQWRAQCEQWRQARASDMDEEGEQEDAADSDLDDDACEPQPRRRSTRRGGRRRARREEPDSGFDAEDSHPAENDADDDEDERA